MIKKYLAHIADALIVVGIWFLADWTASAEYIPKVYIAIFVVRLMTTLKPDICPLFQYKRKVEYIDYSKMSDKELQEAYREVNKLYNYAMSLDMKTHTRFLLHELDDVREELFKRNINFVFVIERE